MLDAATGTGLAAAAVLDLPGSTGRVVGIDLSAAMLRVATSRDDPRCHYVRADAAVPPFTSRIFDAVLCVAAVPYLPDLAAAVDQWRRVTRPGGALVVTTPAADGITVQRLLRHAAAGHGVDVPDPHADLGTPERLTAHGERLGLGVDQIDQLSFADPLDDDPRAAFSKVLDYGFAEPLQEAPDDLRETIYRTFRHAHLEHARTGQGEHTVMFTRYHFPTSTQHPQPS